MSVLLGKPKLPGVVLPPHCRALQPFFHWNPLQFTTEILMALPAASDSMFHSDFIICVCTSPSHFPLFCQIVYTELQLNFKYENIGNKYEKNREALWVQHHVGALFYNPPSGFLCPVLYRTQTPLSVPRGTQIPGDKPSPGLLRLEGPTPKKNAWFCSFWTLSPGILQAFQGKIWTVTRWKMGNFPDIQSAD